MEMVSAKAQKGRKIAKQKKGVIRAKSDFFRTARYGLTLSEHRIIYIALLLGQQNGTPFEPQEIAIKDFMELCELKGQSSYSTVRERSKKLLSKVVEVAYKDTDGTHLLQCTWITSVKYHATKGTVTITPNKELQPFFDGKPFTDTEFCFLIKFNSQYAERLYEVLKTFDYKPLVDFDITDLRTRLGLPESKYPNYNNLKKYVLVPAITDICEYTDLDVSIREKRGLYNKVETVFFTIKKKNVPKLSERISNGEFPVALSEEEQALLMDGLTDGQYDGDNENE
jgi:plasmid replication initiation protein